MKTKIAMAVMLPALVVGLAVWSVAMADDKPGSAPALSTCHLKVEGMTCGLCEKKVKKELTKLEGVKDAQASWKDGRAEVSYDPAKVKKEEFLKAVERAGFKATIAEGRGGE